MSSPAEPDGTTAEAGRNSWPMSTAIALFVIGVTGTIGASPGTSLWIGVISAGIAISSRDLQPLFTDWARSERMDRPPRVTTWLLFAALLIGISAMGNADPTDMWIPLALTVGVPVGVITRAHACTRGRDGRPARWWGVWLTLAALIVGFLAVGGPFRVRWAYCEPKLTAAIRAGEQVSIPNTGRFCWHEARQKDVDGETRLYFSGGEGDDNDGQGLVLSPDGSIERASGIRELRRLSDGWYFFDDGDVVHGFWFDD